MDVTQLALTWVGRPNGANLISTKVSVSHRKSTQVYANPGQTESQVDPSFQFASTFESVWPRLKSHTARWKSIFLYEFDAVNK